MPDAYINFLSYFFNQKNNTDCFILFLYDYHERLVFFWSILNDLISIFYLSCKLMQCFLQMISS